jgi:hypothetical protein
MKQFRAIAILCVGLFLISGISGSVSAGVEPSPFLQGKLGSIAVQLDALDERLERVLNTVGPPAEPVPPEILVELVSILIMAQHIMDLASPYLTGTGIPSSQGENEIVLNTAADTELTPLVKRVSAVADQLLKIDAEFAKVLLYVGPPDQPIDDAVRLEIARVQKNATTIANRAEAYTGGTTPPPTDTPP